MKQGIANEFGEMSNTTEELKILEELLSGVERELKRQRDAVEERRLWYEKTASEWLKKKVVVKFCQIKGGFGGQIFNRPAGFTIHLVPGANLQVERSNFCHEIGHGLMNHNFGWTPEGQEKSELMSDVWQSPELSERLGIDVKKIYQTECQKRWEKEETEADQLGELLFHFYWPDDVYVPGNSTWLQMANKFNK